MAYRNQKKALRALNSLATGQGGYFTAKQAEEAGYAYSHLAYHLKAGNFERAGHGLYRIAGFALSEHDDLVRLSLWSRGRDDRPQAVVSHQTAASLYELGELIPSDIHLTVPRGFRKRAPKGCRLHRRPLGAGQSKEMFGFRVTTPLRTLQDLAPDPTMSREQFEKAAETAVERGLVRRSQMKPLLSGRTTGRGPKKAED